MARNRDTADLIRRLNAIPAAVRAAVDPAVETGAKEIVARARHLAPEETGELQASIVYTTSSRPLSRTVEVRSDHALYMEYGTATNEQHRFFWPAVNTTKKRVKRRIDTAINRAIKKAFGS